SNSRLISTPRIAAYVAKPTAAAATARTAAPTRPPNRPLRRVRRVERFLRAVAFLRAGVFFLTEGRLRLVVTWTHSIADAAHSRRLAGRSRRQAYRSCKLVSDTNSF